MKHSYSKTALAAFFTFIAGVSWGENYTGKVLPLEGGDQVLFTFTRTYKTEGDKTIGVGEYKSPDGQLLVREDTVLQGTKVLSHSVQQNQKNESGRVTIEGTQVNFSYTQNGQEKKAKEDAVDNLVVSASLVPYIQAHWDEILKGDTVKIRYASLDRRETVGFDLFKVDDPRAPAGAITVKMKASRMIIAALVDPLFIYLDAKTKALKELRGRTAPYKKDGSKWNELDAHTVYEVVR